MHRALPAWGPQGDKKGACSHPVRMRRGAGCRACREGDAVPAGPWVMCDPPASVSPDVLSQDIPAVHLRGLPIPDPTSGMVLLGVGTPSLCRADSRPCSPRGQLGSHTWVAAACKMGQEGQQGSLRGKTRQVPPLGPANPVPMSLPTSLPRLLLGSGWAGDMGTL